jgi:hypothetical protein
MMWPMRLEEEKGVSAEKLEAALTCFPATESVAILRGWACFRGGACSRGGVEAGGGAEGARGDYQARGGER